MPYSATNLSDEDQFKQRSEESARSGFQHWISRPEISALISLIPAASDGLLEAILRSAFDAGHSAGQGFTMIEVLRSMKKVP